MIDTYSGVLTREWMESLMRRYFDGCNNADAEAIAACFVPDAIHFFPPGMYDGPFVGAETIARKWVQAVADLGSAWTVDCLALDPEAGRAVMEWSHFKTYQQKMLRGDEWYEFDRETGLIREIRAYYASPQDPTLERLELGGFDYEGRGYPSTSPVPRP